MCARRVHDRHEEDRRGREVSSSAGSTAVRYGPSAGTTGTVYHSCRWPASRRTAPRPHGSAVSAAQASRPPSPAAHASVRSEVFECLMCSTVAHGSGLMGEASFFRTRGIRIPGRALPPACLTLNRGQYAAAECCSKLGLARFLRSAAEAPEKRRPPARACQPRCQCALPLRLLATLGGGRWAWPPPIIRVA